MILVGLGIMLMMLMMIWVWDFGEMLDIVFVYVVKFFSEIIFCQWLEGMVDCVFGL